jgi:hypothetical protein
LRFVCKAFAYNYELLKQLFDNVNLVADVTWLDKLAKVELAAFAPFVNSVTFVPPLYNWLIDKDTFLGLIDDSYRYDYGCYAPDLLKPTTSRYDETGDVRLRERKRESKAFTRYSENAQRNKSLLLESLGAILTLKWSQILRLMNKCHTIHFRTIDHAILDSNLMPRFPACLEDTWDEYNWVMPIPRKNLADLAFGLALEALGRSRTQIHSLDLVKPESEDILWQQNLRNDLLNLGMLKHIELHPIQGQGTPYNESMGISDMLLADASYLLEQSKATIQTLDLRGWSVFDWSAPAQTTPNLRKIVLETCDVNSSMLITWISSSVKLEEIIFDDVGLHSASAGE